MGKKLSVDDRVCCELYNTPEGKFNGVYFLATIIKINKTNEFPHYGYGPFGKVYEVQPDNKQYTLTLHRKEIRRRIN